MCGGIVCLVCLLGCLLHFQVQQKELSDEAIAQAVCLKVGDSPGFSYSHIAAKAYECGRPELAIKVSEMFCQLTLKLSLSEQFFRTEPFSYNLQSNIPPLEVFFLIK